MAKSNETQIMPVVRYRMPSAEVNDVTNDPNQWFADKFPEQTEQYGPAFMEGTWTDGDGLKRFIPAFLNEDAFAAYLGGDRRLGHQVVYCHPEDTFYFYDWRVEAFCPVSEEKLKLLLSNFLIRCSQECGTLVDITPLVTKFRQESTLKDIISKSKAVLATEKSFFEGRDGHRRFIDGRYVHANEEPSYQQFVKKAIVREPEANLTVGDAFHRYYQFCKDNQMKPLTRPEFKELVAEVIREEFRIGLRHDVPTSTGKQGHGWFGVRLDAPDVLGRN